MAKEKNDVKVNYRPGSLLVSVKDMEARITSIHKRAGTLQTDIHLVCCSVLERLMAHEDTRILEKLTDNMPLGQRINAIKQWFELYAPITYVKGKPTFDRAKANSAECIARDGFDKPFFKLAGNEGAAYKPLDVMSTINDLVKKLDKDSKEAGANHSELKAMLLQYMAHEEAKRKQTQAAASTLLLTHVA